MAEYPSHAVSSRGPKCARQGLGQNSSQNLIPPAGLVFGPSVNGSSSKIFLQRVLCVRLYRNHRAPRVADHFACRSHRLVRQGSLKKCGRLHSKYDQVCRQFFSKV